MNTSLLKHTRDKETPSLNHTRKNTSFESHKRQTTSPSNNSSTQSLKISLDESIVSFKMVEMPRRGG